MWTEIDSSTALNSTLYTAIFVTGPNIVSQHELIGNSADEIVDNKDK